MKFKSILFKTLPYVLVVMCIKTATLFIPNLKHFLNLDNNLHITELVDISDVGIIFTGAFFVMGLMLAATMSDFKESEKIPGEVASNLEGLEDNILLALSNFKPTEKYPSLDKAYLYNTLRSLSDEIYAWFVSPSKDSKSIFPALRKMNGVAYYLARCGADKDAIKAIQDNISQLRKQITRVYTISRTNFIAPAYFLLRSIVFLVLLLLFICKFKTITASFLVTIFVSFVFLYLFFLIKGLDDPFDMRSKEGTEVDLLPLDRFRQRINEGLHE